MSAKTTFDSLHTMLTPQLRGCSPLLITQALYEASRVLCRLPLWQETVFTDTLEGVSEYLIKPYTADAEPVLLISVNLKTDKAEDEYPDEICVRGVDGLSGVMSRVDSESLNEYPVYRGSFGTMASAVLFYDSSAGTVLQDGGSTDAVETDHFAAAAVPGGGGQSLAGAGGYDGDTVTWHWVWSGSSPATALSDPELSGTSVAWRIRFKTCPASAVTDGLRARLHLRPDPVTGSLPEALVSRFSGFIVNEALSRLAAMKGFAWYSPTTAQIAAMEAHREYTDAAAMFLRQNVSGSMRLRGDSFL